MLLVTGILQKEVKSTSSGFKLVKIGFLIIPYKDQSFILNNYVYFGYIENNVLSDKKRLSPSVRLLV